MTIEDLIAVFKIILIDIVLSGDNAVVIAMAAHRLPDHQRRRAILWGGGIAIFLRVVFTLVMAILLNVPGVRFIGGVVLVYIACKLLRDEEEHEISAGDAQRSAIAAIRMIFVADFVMSLDNMLAVAGASHGNPLMLLMGLFVSIAIIMTCSALIARLMNRYRWIVVLGAGILALTAGEMILGDRELAGYIVRNHEVSLCSDWEVWMLTTEKIEDFKSPETLSPALAKVVEVHGDRLTFIQNAVKRVKGWLGAVVIDEEWLTFIGQMTPVERNELLAHAGAAEDKQTIEKMYEDARVRDVPGWVPANIVPFVERWFQRKWPAEEWFAVKDHRYYLVSWIFYAIVIAFCLSSPHWWKRKESAGQSPTGPPKEHDGPQPGPLP